MQGCPRALCPRGASITQLVEQCSGAFRVTRGDFQGTGNSAASEIKRGSGTVRGANPELPPRDRSSVSSLSSGSPTAGSKASASAPHFPMLLGISEVPVVCPRTHVEQVPPYIKQKTTFFLCVCDNNSENPSGESPGGVVDARYQTTDKAPWAELLLPTMSVMAELKGSPMGIASLQRALSNFQGQVNSPSRKQVEQGR